MTTTPQVLIWLYLAALADGQDRIARLLPRDARIIETAKVPVRLGKDRTLVLWMNGPRRVVSSWDSAADFLYGNHWLGPTFLSLIDPSNDTLINTISIRPHQETPSDEEFAVPFFTYNGAYYVPHPDKDGRGIPLLLNLKELTGEGLAAQFVLFEHVTSGIAMGSVLGYNARSDRATQYKVEITQDKFSPVVKDSAVGVFDKDPARPGYWKFTWEPGHGAFEWIDEEVRFDLTRQLFTERITTRPYPGFALTHCELGRASLTDFLARMQKAIPDEQEIRWLKDLIEKTTPNNIGSAGLAPTFKGETRLFYLDFQVSNSAAIGIDYKTESDFAGALQAELKAWCGAN
jgi:hypothetical protein